jgi:molecular chaperone DnaJ
MKQQDYYSILGIPRTATPEEIKKAYRKLVIKYHPDKTGGDTEAEAKFKQVAEAYETLGSPDKKQKYDNPSFGNPFNFNGFGGNFHDQFMGGFRNPRYQERDIIRRGKNINARVEITLEEVLNGTKKLANLYRRVQCDDCKGTGAKHGETETCSVCAGIGVKRKIVNTNFGQMSLDETCYSCDGSGRVPKATCVPCQGTGTVRKPDQVEITIPKGSATGITFTVPGKGDLEKSPSDPGDLIISVLDKPHNFYKRDGINLICEKEIGFPDACLGTEISIPNLTSGGEYKISVPKGTSPGKIFRLAGKGVPEFGGDFRGDILVRISLKVPQNLTEEQGEFLEKYKEIF